MSYAAPKIGAAGLSLPSFADILGLYTAGYLSIYGQTENLDNSSAPFQLMSMMAQVAADAMAMGQLIYNNRSPATAVGAGLDGVVENNGLIRKSASFSTCLVVLTGTAGAVITNGKVQDINGFVWDLPDAVTIGGGGTVTVTAVCETAGAINITAPNQITAIVNVQAGWTTVNNSSNVAGVGQPTESDAQLRGRQAVSVELPSKTIIAGTYAGLLATPGVTRVTIDENTGSTPNGNSTPGHSIQAVVQGGTDADVAQAIFNNRGDGAGTFGTTTVAVTDPTTGVVMNISFDRPTLTPIFVIVNAHLLFGGTTATLTAIKTAVVNYLNSLNIGQSVNWTSLIAAAMSVNPNPSIPIVRVETLYLSTSSIGGGTPTADLAMAFNAVAQGITADVAVNSI